MKNKAVFLLAVKDMSESEEACAAAISVPREYYEGAALVLVSAESSAQGGGGGILGVLEIAESDFASYLLRRAHLGRSCRYIQEDDAGDKMLKATSEVDIKSCQSVLKR